MSQTSLLTTYTASVVSEERMSLTFPEQRVSFNIQNLDVFRDCRISVGVNELSEAQLVLPAVSCRSLERRRPASKELNQRG